jgi:hypothetical protein
MNFIATVVERVLTAITWVASQDSRRHLDS